MDHTWYYLYLNQQYPFITMYNIFSFSCTLWFFLKSMLLFGIIFLQSKELLSTLLVVIVSFEKLAVSHILFFKSLYT